MTMAKMSTTKILAEEVLGPPEYDGAVPILTTCVWYEKGGTNLFSGNAGPRGYWLAVRAEAKGTRPGGFEFRRFTLFGDGGKIFLEPAKAFSAKRLAAITPPAEMIEKLRAKVLLERANREARERESHRRDAERIARDRGEAS
jgi:hypothetical protein